MTESNLISQEDAVSHLENDTASFVDCSWYLPAQKRNGRKEYDAMRIPGAVYFDIDEISDKSTDLPHMLPSAQDFAQAVSVLGLSNDKLIILYDGPGLFSAPRVWWTFKVMGAHNVKILKGGIDSWKSNTLPLETGNPNPAPAHIFEVQFQADLVIDQQSIVNSIAAPSAAIIDARPIARFEGSAPEPRAGLRSGHIPTSKSVPFSMLMEDGSLKPAKVLNEIFLNLGIEQDTPVVTTCGSGVTAAILTLALEETGRKNHKLFDGSWAQWGKPDGPAIQTK